MAKIRKIMIADVLTLKKDAKISDAGKLLSGNMHGCVVITEGKKPIGIVTESDIVRNLVIKKISRKDKLAKIMSYPITSIHPDTKLEKASKIIDTKHFRRYPVVDDGILVGLVTENDVVHAINDNISFHRNLQNTILIIFVVFEFFIFILYRYIANFFPFLR